MASSRVALKTLRDSLFADNTTGLVTPSYLRQFLDSLIDSDYNIVDDQLASGSTNSHYFYAGPSSGLTGPATFRPIVPSDLPGSGAWEVTDGDLTIEGVFTNSLYLGVGTFDTIGIEAVSSVNIQAPLVSIYNLSLPASISSRPSLHIDVGTTPSSPADGDMWLESNTNTGLKIRINGVTKTITLS